MHIAESFFPYMKEKHHGFLVTQFARVMGYLRFFYSLWFQSEEIGGNAHSGRYFRTIPANSTRRKGKKNVKKVSVQKKENIKYLPVCVGI